MEKRYPLSKEDIQLYLACTHTPDRKFAYLVGWSLILPAEESEKERVKERLADAVRKVFKRHRIFSATIIRDREEGSLWKYDCGREPFIEYMKSDSSDPAPEDYYVDMELDGGRLYRIVIVDIPSGVKIFMIFHHIVLDGTGRQNMVRDFEKAYKGEDIGKADMTPYELGIKEIEDEKKEGYVADRDYYNKILSGLETGNPEYDTFGSSEGFSRFYFPFDKISPNKIKEKKEKCGIRTSTIFMAAVGYALAVFAGTDQSLVASAMSGRSEENRTGAGMFVRTLPMVCNIGNDRSVDDYLKDIDEQTTKGREHSLYTYMDMKREHNLTVSVSFAYQGDMISDRVLFDGTEQKMSFLRSNESDYEMRLYLWRKDGKYLFEAVYRDDHYSREFMDSLAECVEMVLIGLLECDRLSKISLVESRQEELMEEWNRTEYDHPSRDVVSMFRDTVRTFPDREAVVFKEETLTYAELDDISERIAAYLVSKGIGKGDRVSILIHRGVSMVTAPLGVLKAGAAYQPLDNTYPAERLKFMTEDASSAFLIADEDLLGLLAGYEGEILLTKDIPSLPEGDVSGHIHELSDLFILLYTSGSTGTPKGVMLEHGSISNFCYWYRDYFKMDHNSRVAAYASFGFDANMMDMYPALISGASLCIMEEEIRLDIPAMEEWFNRLSISHAFMTTQVSRQFYISTSTPKLKYLLAGGEKLVPLSPDREGLSFFNIYGPTECTILISVMPVKKLYNRVPIGRPVYNTKIYVTDSFFRRLPLFAPGELQISGHGVARGYLNRPEHTEKAFLDNPFTKEAGYSRIYRSGDIVRLMADGNIDFVGRNDGQVKVRGFRIELTEIEAKIREFEGIEDATVQAFEDKKTGEKRIFAYVVSKKKVDTDALKAFIAEHKPLYMVPSGILQIDMIPLNQNGKVNKRMLPEPANTVNFGKAEGVQKSADNLLEEKLKEEIKSITENGDIPYNIPLSSIGLTSIGVLRLSAFIYKEFGVNLDTKFFRDVTLITLENGIISSWMNKKDKGGIKEEKRDSYPLSAVQQALYFDAMKNKGDTAYNVPMCLRFEDIDADRLAFAVSQAIGAHGFLNTYVELRDDKLALIPVYDKEPYVKILTLSEKEWEKYRKGFVQPFNPGVSPLYRFAIVKTPEYIYLLFDIHHLLFDGFSARILINDISLAYLGRRVSKEKYTAYDYACEDNRFAYSEEYEKAGKYFDKLLQPFDSPSDIAPDLMGKGDEGRLAEKTGSIVKELVDDFCRKNNISHSAAFLTSVFYVLSRICVSDDILISALSSGRRDPRLERTIGMFVHTIPLAMHFDSGMTAKELMRASGDVLENSIANEAYPFASLAAKYGLYTNIMYECQIGIVNDCGEIGGKKYTQIPMQLDTPKFHISVIVLEKGDSYCIKVRYNDALYSEEYMQIMADSLVVVMNRLIENTGAPISTFSLLNDRETERVNSFGSSAVKEQKISGLHRLFERTADRFSSKTALIARDRTLNYGQLNDLSDRVAGGLMERGLKRGERVVILLPRKSVYFATLFGVLKAGGAFVPCDPEYPSDRIRYIAGDSAAGIIITEKARLRDFPESGVDVEDLISSEKITESIESSKEDIAYIIYTSGSTGRPKGVMLTHGGICNYCDPHPSNILYDPKKNDYDVIISVTTVAFDMSLKDTAGMLLNGKTIVFADEDEMNDPRELTRLFEETGADAFSATPSRILQYMEYEPFSKALSKCKLIIAGAEPYPKKLLKRLQGMKGVRLINSYGPTEITVSSNMADLTNAHDVTVGKPLLNYREWIVDKDMNPIPEYVTGELIIGGEGVAKGYVGSDEKTAQSFIEYNGERVYRTGDYAKWDKDGNVVILGRMDSQIKLRGLRIELSEISSVMEQLPGIKRAICVVRRIHGTDNLCAYYTSDTHKEPEKLRELLGEKLTKYMVPTAFMQLEEIPVTRNGKLDLKALPEPELLESGEYVSPANDMEKYFCSLFGKVLGLEKVGALDDFFSIGGSSLLATGIMIDATQKGYELSYGDVFRHKTPRAMAALFDDTGECRMSCEQVNKVEAYDYNAIDTLLLGNTLEAFEKGKTQDLGNVLITGATGFMGVHLLAEFLRSERGLAWCIIRKGRYEDPLRRLKNMLFYYFGDEFDQSLERIRVVDGDVTDYESFRSLEKTDIATVFNCAASVRHFSNGTEIEDVNVGGTRNCVSFCVKTGARLIHFSSISVAGVVEAGDLNKDKVFDECCLYRGQIIDNAYVISKFLSEREVLASVAEKKLEAKVIRVGTLSPRESDGEFQINYLSNSFMERLRGYMLLKSFPYSRMGEVMRLGPIDTSAVCFMKLAKTPKECVLFHAVNDHTIPAFDVIRIMQKMGMDIHTVDDEGFSKALSEAERNPKIAAILSGFLAYKRTKPVAAVPIGCEYTTQVLARMGFFWNMPDKEYIGSFIGALMNLGFFDEDNLVR